MSGAVCPLPATETARVELGHGEGGALMHRLITELFRPELGMTGMAHDGAVLPAAGERLAFTTDSFVVTPLEFPGGDIGALAVIGTLNDLAMCGARPRYLSASFILEEGLDLALLRRIAASMGAAAAGAGVQLVTADTKVVERGKGDAVYITTSGIGVIARGVTIGPHCVRPGDAVVLSGDIGRHGIAVMAARESLGFDSTITSDMACLVPLVQALLEAGVELHCLRDLTRGGLATALVEIAIAANLRIEIEASAVAVCDAVQGACEILGLDPWYVANEGRLIAFMPAAMAERALAILPRHEGCAAAAVIGRVTAVAQGGMVLASTLGGSRVIDMLSGGQLPRIC